MTQVCTKCGLSLPLSEFYTYNRGGAQKRRRDCKRCVVRGASTQKHPEFPDRAAYRQAVRLVADAHADEVRAEYDRLTAITPDSIAPPAKSKKRLLCDVCGELLVLHRIGQHA